MSKCRDLDPLLTPYVDGEASTADRSTVDAHLQKCPPCRDLVSDERTVRTVLAARRDDLRTHASEQLKQRCADCFAPAGSGPASGWLSRRTVLPLSMAATFVLAVGAAVFFGLTSSVEALAAQLAVDHVKCFQFAPAETHGVDHVALGLKWAADRGWTLKVPASHPGKQLQLLTVRRCASSEGVTAHLMYLWKGEPLSVYVLNSGGTAAARGQLVETIGQEAVIWSARGRTYAVVARARPSDLEPVVHYVRETAE
jgi:anti-sigma factor RsiW